MSHQHGSGSCICVEYPEMMCRGEKEGFKGRALEMPTGTWKENEEDHLRAMAKGKLKGREKSQIRGSPGNQRRVRLKEAAPN